MQFTVKFREESFLPNGYLWLLIGCVADMKQLIGQQGQNSNLFGASWFKIDPSWFNSVVTSVKLVLTGKSAEVYLEPELVGFGCQVVDEIQDVHPPVSFYVYQCIIKCWESGERVMSESVRVPVSTFTLPDKSLPEFKIALLICQEEYDYQVINIDS